MTDAFCPSCGIKTEGNVTIQTADRLLQCDCGFSMRFYILHTQTKTGTEVRQAFQNTKLTHKQEFG